MQTEKTYSGLECIGDVPWGSHFCQFFKTADDLADSLVPYFKAGLDNNEQCLWVTAEPFKSADARAALSRAVPDLREREKSGQIEIIDYTDWYVRAGTMSTEEVLRGWVRKQEEALQRGYGGLRLTGNTFWLERADWEPFMAYEDLVTATFKPHRMIALCSYCMERCHSEGMLDVVQNHEFAVVRRHGSWHVIENAATKQAKAELRRLNTELEDRVRSRTADLEKMIKVRDEFVSVASHELKTPIAALRLYIDGLRRMNERSSLSADELNRRLARADAQCTRLDGLVTSLLDVSRAGEGKLPIRREEMRILPLIDEIAERFAAQAEAAGSRLFVTGSDLCGHWDRLRIDQILTNLVANAIKYAPGAEIEISAVERDGSCLLNVRDTGPGIPESHRDRIFERFTQVSHRESAGGFGLGLWIVRQIATALGGRVTLSSREGEGSIFTVELPLRVPGQPGQEEPLSCTTPRQVS